MVRTIIGYRLRRLPPIRYLQLTQMKKVAIDIKTEKLYSIINILRKDGWIVSAKYYGFDAGIDDDYWCLRRGFKKIEFGWSNWTEGEIKTTNEIFKQLEHRFKIKFEYGEPLKTYAF